MGVIYLPIDTLEMRTVANNWNAGRVAKNKPPHTIIRCRFTGLGKAIRRIGFGALRFVAANERVYVLAHGLTGPQWQEDQPITHVTARRGAVRGTGQIPTWIGGTRKSYTPRALARNLRDEALDPNIQDVRLFACHGAEGQLSFGEQFDQEMQQYFPNVTVSAYLGSLRGGYGARDAYDGDVRHPDADDLTQDHYKGAHYHSTHRRARHRRVSY